MGPAKKKKNKITQKTGNIQIKNPPCAPLPRVFHYSFFFFSILSKTVRRPCLIGWPRARMTTTMMTTMMTTMLMPMTRHPSPPAAAAALAAAAATLEPRDVGAELPAVDVNLARKVVRKAPVCVKHREGRAARAAHALPAGRVRGLRPERAQGGHGLVRECLGAPRGGEPARNVARAPHTAGLAILARVLADKFQRVHGRFVAIGSAAHVFFFFFKKNECARESERFAFFFFFFFFFFFCVRVCV
jgi:hypothetical protein